MRLANWDTAPAKVQGKSRSSRTTRPAGGNATASVARMLVHGSLSYARCRLTLTLSDAPPTAPDCNRDATGAFAEAKVRPRHNSLSKALELNT